jgi:hypothetical protein
MDYKNAGVDIEAGYKSVELMKEHVKKTMRPEVLGGLGGFSGAFSLAKICQSAKIWNSSPVFTVFPWQKSKKWKSRCCFPVQTDAEPR